MGSELQNYVISKIPVIELFVSNTLTLSHYLSKFNSKETRTISMELAVVSLLLTLNNFKKNFMTPFLWMGFYCLKATESLRGGSLILPLSSQKFLVLILSTSEVRKTESTLKLPISFEHGNPGFRIQRPNRQVF